MEAFVSEVHTLITESIGIVRHRHVNYIRFFSSISFYQKYLLFFMFCTYANDHLSRYLVNYQYAEPSEDSYHSLSMATNISSFGYGNVIGFGFSLSFVFFGMWVARMINDYSPRNLLLFALITWSTGTLMLARSTNFGNLMGARIILGLGQAFCVPACYSLLTHHFPHDDYSPLVRSIFGYGAYAGTALSSLSILFLQDFGWRSCATVVGSTGFCMVIVLYMTVSSPPKRERAYLRKEIRPLRFTIEDVYLEIMSNNAVITLFGAACIRFMAEYTLASFLPLFFLNKFPDQKLSFSILNALIILFVGGISSVLGSSSSVVLALDKPGSVRGSCTLLLLLIASSLLSIPALLLMLLSPSFYLSIFGLLIVYLLSEWWFRPFIFVFQRELSPEARNIALGFLSATATLSGSIACTVVGYFIGRKDDNLHGNVHVPPKNVTVSLSWSVGVIYFLSVVLFAIVYIMVVQDVDKEEEKILSGLGIECGDMGSEGKFSESDRLLGNNDSNGSVNIVDSAHKPEQSTARNPLSAAASYGFRSGLSISSAADAEGSDRESSVVADEEEHKRESVPHVNEDEEHY